MRMHPSAWRWANAHEIAHTDYICRYMRNKIQRSKYWFAQYRNYSCEVMWMYDDVCTYVTYYVTYSSTIDTQHQGDGFLMEEVTWLSTKSALATDSSKWAKRPRRPCFAFSAPLGRTTRRDLFLLVGGRWFKEWVSNCCWSLVMPGPNISSNGPFLMAIS